MLKTKFYCDIHSEYGNIIEEDFAFDNGNFESQEELERYIKKCGYEIGEPCGYWGDDVGILKEVVTDEVDEL